MDEPVALQVHGMQRVTHLSYVAQITFVAGMGVVTSLLGLIM
ncbi:hypothetical protein MAE02_66520 [Microvirga aerophila]|uniref:Uncharacterized protein n=1 Tax=Microvirga aerophila TaxID=670291 RepID=A0A512C411_9HYPH|nr:hypothetical protein MAE02_66520 [Microvirga aerophila]